MFNLLPKEKQQGVSREYRLRLADASLLFLASLATLASIALIPSLVLSYQMEGTNFKNVEVLRKEIATVTSDDPSSKLEFGKKKVAALSVGNPAVYSYELIDIVIRSQTRGIKILGVDIKRGEGEIHDIVITGTALDREALLLFTRVLEKERKFVSVTVPVSNFAPVANINFSILIKTK